MIGWLRRMIGYYPERRARPRALPGAGPLPTPPPLPTTRAELARTAPAHRRKLAKTDAFLRDITEMDAALRLVRR